jgi:hypothetical protein
LEDWGIDRLDMLASPHLPTSVIQFGARAGRLDVTPAGLKHRHKANHHRVVESHVADARRELQAAIE